MKCKTIMVVGAIITLMSTLLAGPVSAQDGRNWYKNPYGGTENKNDSPQLQGPAQWWWDEDPSGTHGQDHHGTYHYTYGNDDADRTNWATWNFTGLSTWRSRIYDVWVWVPRNHASAQVRYKVHLQECTNPLGTYPVLDQAEHGGWVKIGRVSLGHLSNPPSRNIVIEVNDNEIADPSDGPEQRSIGVDAMLLVRDGGIDWDAVNSNHLITDENCYGGRPNVPRNLAMKPSGDVFRITWDAPANNGGSPIVEYETSYSRPAVGNKKAWNGTWTTTRESHRFRPLYKNVPYTVKVVAINEDDERSPVAQSTATIDPPAGLPTTSLSTDYSRVDDCWTRPPEWDGYKQGQCTSYVAWRLRENGVGEDDAYGDHYGFYNQWKAGPCAAVDRHGVARWGNARQWDDCAKQIGIKVDNTPSAGSVLVRNDIGCCGHVAYVEAVNSDGSIVVSDSNYDGRCGLRTRARLEKGTDIYRGDYSFIHFEDSHAKRLAS